MVTTNKYLLNLARSRLLRFNGKQFKQLQGTDNGSYVPFSIIKDKLLKTLRNKHLITRGVVLKRNHDSALCLTNS